MLLCRGDRLMIATPLETWLHERVVLALTDRNSQSSGGDLRRRGRIGVTGDPLEVRRRVAGRGPNHTRFHLTSHRVRKQVVPLTNKQRRLHERAKGILLDETSQEDAHERIGLLTVIAGIRPVALFLSVEEPDR